MGTFNIKAILLLGGTGVRFGSETPKQFHRLSGKKIYLHTLEQLISSSLFEEIILVYPKGWKEEVSKELPHFRFKLIEGGETRQESSYRGLLACGLETDIVLIHDAVRPFVSQEILKENVSRAILYGAVDTCIPSADTLVHAPAGKEIASIPKRSEYLRGQTPQTFSYPLILHAHEEAMKGGVLNASDDCSLVLKLGKPVHITLGSEENIKITSELDLILAQQILRRKCALPLPCVETALTGKRFAITGGSGDIGQSIAKMLEMQGAHAVILSRSSPDFSADLTSFSQSKAAFDQIHQKFGPLDGLINGVGLLKIKNLDALTSEEIDLMIATNLNSVIYACKCAHLKKGAHILNIASSSYIHGKKGYALYSAAKAAVVNFTQGLAEERPDLQINAVVPERALTRMRTLNFPEEDRSKLLSPEEIAEKIASVLRHPLLTGSTIEVRKL